MSHSSVSRVIVLLLEEGIVIEKKIGKIIRMIQINPNSEVAQETRDYFKAVFSE